MSEVHELPLDVLDPEAFPDLGAVRAFVGGEAFRFMMYRVQDVLDAFRNRVDPLENSDLKGLPDDALVTAGEVAFFLSEDLISLAGAAVQNEPVEATYGSLASHDDRRMMLTALALCRDGSTGADHLCELLRYLGPRPQSAWEYDHGSPTQEASQ